MDVLGWDNEKESREVGQVRGGTNDAVTPEAKVDILEEMQGVFPAGVVLLIKVKLNNYY